ncbi:MAG TPA: ATP-binding protein [Burkholderiales bacterium]|nr:ATP-binding protein [Burkholderiales bacterium]
MKPDPKLVKSRLSLASFARRIPARATWQKLALSPKQLAALRQIVDQASQSPGVGRRALLAGPAGNHKTMAAQVLARELQHPLYRIDLTSVVSKYIGQTEKNLKVLFAAAETASAILMFDEADAIFGKRTQVRDAHDRYAKREISCVQAAVNSYNGLLLVAASQKSNLDPAFTRRLRHLIVFS